jgi:type I restriction enzyme S subunit
MSFPRYKIYKDSGVEWLGDVPAHWIVLPIKHLGRLKGGAGFPHTEQGIEGEELSFHKVNALAQAGSDGVLLPSENTITRNTAAQLGAFVFPPKSVVFAKVGAALLLGRIRVLGENACIDNNMMGLVVYQSEHDVGFVRYAMSLVRFDLIANPGAVPSLNESQIGNFPLIVPRHGEQREISSFLDRETAKIDALIAEQQRLIELLKEKRQAVISHAVTKGINPDAPMKDSCIEWLGEVPAHWEVGRVKTYFQTCSGGTPNTSQQELYYSSEEEGIPWIRTTDLNNAVLRNVEVFITEKALADTACSILPIETVMVAMYGGDGTVGKNGLLGIPAAINQAVCGLLPAKTHNPNYVFRFIQFYRPYWMIGAESARKDPNISQERVGNAPFLQPPIKEQNEIVSFLDRETAKLDSLTDEAQRGIELLKERRTALISAAVTGKIDVRGLVAVQAQTEAAA